MKEFNDIPKLPSLEEENNPFESSKRLGAVYTSHIQRLVGRSESAAEKKSEEVVLDEFIKAGNSYFQELSEKFKERGGTISVLISQLSGVFPHVDFSGELVDPSKYELLEPSEGVFILKVDEKILEKILPNTTAVAIKPKDGISFVIIPRYNNNETNQQIWHENIPHEVHHLFWKGVMNNNLLMITESDPDFRSAFTMYQDELIARMCSGGGLSGYSHLHLLDPAAKEEFKKEKMGKFDEIIQAVSDLNDFLRTLSFEMMERNVRRETLIGAVIKARSFKELQEKLSECRDHILNQPVLNSDKPESGGWNFV